jgi:invasion protein IalB
MTRRLTTALLALLATTAVAAAQSQPAQKPAQPAKPAATAAQPAQQQAAAPEGDATPALSGPQPEWIKVCSTDPQAKKEICQISRDLRSDTGQTLASVAIREVKGGKRAIVLAIPPGMQIQPGVRVFVDKNQAVNGRFSVCMQNACFVEAELPDPVLATFKKGTLLTLQAVNVQGRGVQLPFQLAGFGKAYDGAPIDPKVIEDNQKKLQQQLIERANKARAEQDQGAAPAQ